MSARQTEMILAQVFGFLGRFISYPSEHAHVAHALWCVYSQLMNEWDSTPRIAFLSPEPASGKSRALEITELLVPNPVAAISWQHDRDGGNPGLRRRCNGGARLAAGYDHVALCRYKDAPPP